MTTTTDNPTRSPLAAQQHHAEKTGRIAAGGVQPAPVGAFVTGRAAQAQPGTGSGRRGDRVRLRLDPAISPAYAALQAPRVARETGVPLDTVKALIEDNTTGRGLGFLGDPAVNVLKLNLAVQAAKR